MEGRAPRASVYVCHSSASARWVILQDVWKLAGAANGGRALQVCDYVLALSWNQGAQLQLQHLKSRRRFLDCWALDFRCRVNPGAWGVAPPLRLNVDLVVNSALLVKTLQVRQQGGLRESHRFWCWPQRSSHGQDQLGYRPCTLTRGPAPKSTTTLFYIAVSCLLFFLRKSRGEVLKKISTDDF